MNERNYENSHEYYAYEKKFLTRMNFYSKGVEHGIKAHVVSNFTDRHTHTATRIEAAIEGESSRG
jgi:hypothetical protein